MPSLPYLVSQNERRRTAARSDLNRRLGLFFSTILSLAALALLLAAAWLYTGITQDLPDPQIIPALLEPPTGSLLEPTRLYDRTGQHLLLTLEDPAAGERQYITLPAGIANPQPAGLGGLQALAAATIAAQDRGFWRHSGFTLQGLTTGAHPTLAQRLVSDLILWQEPAGLRRNLRERLLAAQLTARFGRVKVLEWYLNSTRYGKLVYGAGPAAEVYFGAQPGQLSLAQAALLSAVAEAPDINPLDAPEPVYERQRQVLASLKELGMVSTAQHQQAEQEKLKFSPASQPVEEIAPAFTAQVLSELETYYGAGRVERGGLVVRTTLDIDLQGQAACAAALQVSRLEGSPDSQAGASCEAGRLLPTVPGGEDSQPGTYTAQVLVLNPNSGQVLALAAPEAGLMHAPGTLISAFIHLTAYTRGLSPASLVWDIPTSLPPALLEAQDEIPEFHGPVSLRAALANDYDAPNLQVLAQVGPENVWQTASQLGLRSTSRSDLERMLYQTPLFSGGQASLAEISQAFGVFATQGKLVGRQPFQVQDAAALPPLEPLTILSVEDLYGRPQIVCDKETGVNCTLEERSVVSPQLAYLAVNVLSDESARWPSLGHPNALEIGRPVAAKVGKEQGIGEWGAWTVGFTPNLVVTTWVGQNSADAASLPPSGTLELGASGLWHAVMQYAVRDAPLVGWNMPAGVSRMEVCQPSGLLPTTTCPNVVPEIFLSGNEPHSLDSLYQTVQVNRETGRLATVFTPPELVEKQVYLMVPPEAVDWAEDAGVETPPEDYDVLYSPPRPLSGVQINLPAMFSQVGGQVKVSGTAAGDDFLYYRVLVGAGLNPTEWLQVGEDVSAPVTNGTLAEWDTRGLSGLYALQLLVVRGSQRVDRAVIQVTVDNNPPEIGISELSSIQAGQNIVLQAAITDEGVAEVEFSIDGELFATLYLPPFNLAWKATPGEHTFRVRATDLAGNTSEASVTFVVAP